MAAFHSFSQYPSTNEVCFPNVKSDLLPTPQETSLSFLDSTSRQPANASGGDSKKSINSRRFNTQNTQLSESYLNSDKQKIPSCKSNPNNSACAGYSKQEFKKYKQKTLSDSLSEHDTVFELNRPIDSIPLTTLEIEAMKRAEERTQRRLSRHLLHSTSNLGIERSSKASKEVISQRNYSSAFVNDGQMPPRSKMKNSASVIECETLAEDSLSLNEVKILFGNCNLKQEETTENTTDDYQSDLPPRSRRIAVCDYTDASFIERKNARINLKRFGVLDSGN